MVSTGFHYYYLSPGDESQQLPLVDHKQRLGSYHGQNPVSLEEHMKLQQQQYVFSGRQSAFLFRFLRRCVTGLKKKKKGKWRQGVNEPWRRWWIFLNSPSSSLTSTSTRNNRLETISLTIIIITITVIMFLSSPPTCWTVAPGDSRTDGGWMRHTSSRVCTHNARETQRLAYLIHFSQSRIVVMSTECAQHLQNYNTGSQ